MTLLAGDRIHNHQVPDKGGFVAGISGSVHHSLSLSKCLELPSGFFSPEDQLPQEYDEFCGAYSL